MDVFEEFVCDVGEALSCLSYDLFVERDEGAFFDRDLLECYFVAEEIIHGLLSYFKAEFLFNFILFNSLQVCSPHFYERFNHGR